MDYRPDWIDGTDEPAIAVLASNTMSKMARRADQINEEVTKIKQRVDRMINTFERTHGVLSGNQGPDMEIMENMDELESILHDQDQKRKYQQKLTVFIVGFQETCGQRRHLLTQLQEFFSIHSNMNEVEEDHHLGQPCIDLDGIAFQVTGAVRSAETAMSRLNELHKVVMSHLSQAVSAGAQAKRKPSDDRGKKKLEKLLQQARLDIGQLTDKLLQTQEELTLKDQQMKELQKQNERRMMEINRVKSQMDVTKKSLHIVQEETAIQRSLLEAEIRRQAGQLEELESQKVLKGEELTDSSTQWEIADCMLRFIDENLTANNEEENVLEESMEASNEIPLTDINDEHKMQELIATNTNNELMDNMTKLESQECTSPPFPVFEENILALPHVSEDHILHTLSNLEEDTSTSNLCPHNKSCVTPPLSLPVIPADAVQQGVNDASQLNFANSMVVPQETTTSVGNLGFEPVSLLPMTNASEPSAKSHPHSDEMTDSNDVSFPMPGNEADSTATYDGSDHVSHAISERYNSPISNEATQTAFNSQMIHLVPTKRSSPMVFLMSEDTNPIKSSNVSKTDTHLKYPVFDLNLECNQHANGSISISAPDKKTQYFSSFPVIHQTTDVNTSPSPISSSFHSNTLPLANMNINMDQSLWTTLHSLPDIKTFPNKAPMADVTAKETERSHIPISDGESSGPCVLEAETKTEATSHARQGEAATVETPDSGTHYTELRWLSKRLHKCVREIRSLLITEGFQPLADMLGKGIQDETEEGLSTNLTQLESFPTVLQSLLHNISRKSTEHVRLTKEHSPDSVIRNEEDKTDSSLPVKHNEDESQKCGRLSMKTHRSCDFGHTSSLIFTRTDEEHNKRELQWASFQGRIPIHIYQDISRMMSKYRILSQERLHCLVWGYVQYISWNRAENLLRRQSHSRPQINPVLHKLQKKKDQAFLQWRNKIVQSQEQRLRLSAVLNHTLQGVQEDTGLFLVKPQISWAGSSLLETRKQISSSKMSVQHFSPQCQDGIICHGISPPHVAKKWKYMHTHTELRPLVVTPKLLEMDIQRYLCKDCCVMSQLQHSLHWSPLKKASTQRNLVHVKRNAVFPAL